MRFQCPKAALQKEIAFAQEIVSTKNVISILSNVLLIAKDGFLEIRATDIKVHFKTSFAADIEEEGSTTVFCDKLLSILSTLPEGDILFVEEGEKITISPAMSNKRVKFSLKSIASDKFPEFLDIDESNFFEIPVAEFKKMINMTIFAVSDDETRYFMNGVYIEKDNDSLLFVATDGRRLSLYSGDEHGHLPDFRGIIVPPKILSIVLKRSGDEGLLGIAITDRIIYIKIGNYLLSSVLIDGQFPQYQRVIPEKQEYSVIFSKADMLDGLRRVSLLVEQKSRRVYLRLRQDELELSSEETDFGVAKESIPIEYEGPETSIAINYKYIEDPLKVMDVEMVRLAFTETTKAISIFPVLEKANYFHIVMPMQLE
jgi:DNA polymerase-3 subunit beta